jgi:ATP-dependent Zn protease
MTRYQQAQLERQRRLNAGLRTWAPPDLDLNVAAHEAGHAVASWRLSLDPTRATIEPGHGYAGMVSFRRAATEMDREQAFDHAIVLAAGDVAEKLLGGPADCGKDDLTQRALLGPFCETDAEVDDMIADARRAARRMLKAHAGPLISITVALIAKRTLDQDAIAEIMTPADDDDDGELISFEDAMFTRMVYYQGRPIL